MFSDQIKFESKMSSTFLFVEMVKDGLIMTELDVRSKVEMNIVACALVSKLGINRNVAN